MLSFGIYMSNDLNNIDWKKIRAVIFDVDGTLYLQSALRKKMLYDLLGYFLVRPWKWKDLLILYHFRKEREKRSFEPGSNLEQAQYEWCSEKCGYPIESVKRVIEKWIFTHPNQYLLNCTYPGTKMFFDTLKKHGIKTAIFSEYKATEKLQAMGLNADLVACSTDPDIDQFKPNPKGLLVIAEKFGLSPWQCLFIGDREDKDGKCAQQAQMPYLIVDIKPIDSFNFYTTLSQQLDTQFKPSIYEPDFSAP